MSISPVDMQVMMTKTTEIASKHSSELHKAVANQQNVNQKENIRQEEQTKKVHDRNNTERIYVDEEEEKNKNQQGNDKKKSNNNEDDNEEQETKVSSSHMVGGHFDASI